MKGKGWGTPTLLADISHPQVCIAMATFQPTHMTSVSPWTRQNVKGAGHSYSGLQHTILEKSGMLLI